MTDIKFLATDGTLMKHRLFMRAERQGCFLATKITKNTKKVGQRQVARHSRQAENMRLMGNAFFQPDETRHFFAGGRDSVEPRVRFFQPQISQISTDLHKEYKERKNSFCGFFVSFVAEKKKRRIMYTQKRIRVNPVNLWFKKVKSSPLFCGKSNFNLI